jgi:hypothetical protein
MKLTLALLFSILAVNSANAQCATDTLADQCAQKAGGRCDPATNKWSGGNKKTYVACVSAAGRTKTVTDTQGRTVTQKLTGRYSDCIRDGQKLGHSPDAVKRYCDSRPLR